MENHTGFLRIPRTVVLFFMALGLATASVWAQTTVNANWTDSTGNWTTPSNWSCNCVPNNSSANSFNVTIQTGPTGPVPDAEVSLDNTSSLSSITINTLSLGGGSTYLQIEGGESLDVIGNLSVTAVGESQATIGGNSAVNVAGSTNNAGNFVLDSGVLRTDSFTNSGFIQIGPTQGTLLSVNPGGTYTQTGGFTHLPGTVIGGFPQSSGTLMAPSVDIIGGTLYGTGTVAGSLANNGIVFPGDACLCDGVLFPDPNLPYTTMPINGNYSQTAHGTMLIGISSATNFSILDVSGDAALGGIVDFDFLNGYIPGPNTDFAFLKAGSVVGDFSSLDFMGINCPSCTFNLSTLSLDTGSTPPTFRPPVPEPGTLILFGTALLGLAALLRKRQGFVVRGS